MNGVKILTPSQQLLLNDMIEYYDNASIESEEDFLKYLTLSCLEGSSFYHESEADELNKIRANYILRKYGKP